MAKSLLACKKKSTINSPEAITTTNHTQSIINTPEATTTTNYTESTFNTPEATTTTNSVQSTINTREATTTTNSAQSTIIIPEATTTTNNHKRPLNTNSRSSNKKIKIIEENKDDVYLSIIFILFLMMKFV